MVVGLLQVELHIHGAMSLKDKRRVLRSVKDRLHREHMVAVAEVGDPERWSVAVLAIAGIASGQRGPGAAARIGEVFDRIGHSLRRLHDAELVAEIRQFLPVPMMGLAEDANPAESGQERPMNRDDDPAEPDAWAARLIERGMEALDEDRPDDDDSDRENT